MDKNEKQVSEKEIAKGEIKETPKAKSADELKAERKAMKQEAIAKKFSRFGGQSTNALKSNGEFSKLANDEFNAALNDTDLVAGSNPSAKYLRQEFQATPNADVYANLLNRLAPVEEFIGEGKGAEYGLVNGLAVNKLDDTKFIPQGRNDMGNYTYWDTIELESDPTKFDKVECTISFYQYIQYYLTGKLDELVSIIKPQMEQAFIRNQAKRVLTLIQLMFRQTMAKASSTAGALTNHLAGTTTLSQVDSVKEWLDFEFGLGYDNVQFNYGIDTYNSGTSSYDHTDFTDAYNSLPESERVYLCEYETYNNLKKYATTFLAKDAIDKYFKMDKWLILPRSIYNNATNSPTAKGSIDQLLTFSTYNSSTSAYERVPGAIMVMDRRALKRVYNYSKMTSEYYAPNDTTGLFAFKNWAIKFLKWGQVAVYNNSALESSFVVPTSTVTLSK